MNQIIGIGVDIVKTQRINISIKNQRFINRIFSKNEISISKRFSNKTNFFSKRFAAKEAFAKALGTGFRHNLNFKDIQILNDNIGKPYYLINSRIRRLIQKHKKIKKFNLFLSISDEKDYSVAFTILQMI